MIYLYGIDKFNKQTKDPKVITSCTVHAKIDSALSSARNNSSN